MHLTSAHIILLLVSPDFIASDYCYGIEMTKALERHERKEARVIPIILRPTDWNTAPFGKLAALPRDGKPVTIWNNRDQAFLDIAKGIRKAVEELNVSSTWNQQSISISTHQNVDNSQFSLEGRPESHEVAITLPFDPSKVDREKLIKDIINHYDYESLEILCDVSLNIYLGNIVPEIGTLRHQIIRLIKYLQATNRYRLFLKAIIEEYPEIIYEIQ